MRTIKFRAWDKILKRISEVSCINYFDDIVILDETNMGHVTQKMSDVELMQFTGLLDKNGKEIYEGDIVRILYTDWASQSDYSIPLEEYKKSISKIGKIEWNEDAYWCLNFGKSGYGDDDIGGLHEGPHGEKEIIGNIYENPELLSNPVQ